MVLLFIILSVSTSSWHCTFVSRFGHLLVTCLLQVLNAAGRVALLSGEAQFSLRPLVGKKEFESFPSGYGLVSCE